MNLRYTFLVVLLLSLAPRVQARISEIDFRSDYDECCLNEYTSVALKDPSRYVSQENFLLLFQWLIAQKLPGKNVCDFNPQGRDEKAIIKTLLNDNVIKNSLDIPLALTPNGAIYLVNTDQAMELALTLFNDLMAHKNASTVLGDLFQTFAREKIVGTLVWLLQHASIENALPTEIATSKFYHELRNEIARYYVDKALDKVL